MRSKSNLNSYHNASYDTVPRDYNYCRPTNDPNFSLYQSLMLIAYSSCDENKLEYDTCQQKQDVFSNGNMAISNNLGPVFDTACPCVIYRKVGHTFEGCEEFNFLLLSKKRYVQLCVTLQNIKGIGANKTYDIKFLRSIMISYVNSVVLLPPPQLPVCQDQASSSS